MKKVLITLGLLIFAFAARAQWTLQTYGEYDYTRTSGNSASLALKADYQLAENFNIGFGYQGTTLNRHAINLQYQVNLLKATLEGVVRFSSADVIRKYGLNSSANVKRVKDALMKKEILVFDDEDQPEFLDPLFEYWIKKYYFELPE